MLVFYCAKIVLFPDMAHVVSDFLRKRIVLGFVVLQNHLKDNYNGIFDSSSDSDIGGGGD